MVKTSEFAFASPCDGLNIHVLQTAPAGKPRGVVQFAHGMAEHKRRYLPLMEALSEAGYLCAVNDHRGHGLSVRSPEDLGHFDAGALVDDILALSKHLKARHPGAPLFLFGHSMGALAARCCLKKGAAHLSGLILSGSPSENPMSGPGLALVRVLSTVRGGRYRSGMMDKLVNSANANRFPNEPSSFAWLCGDPAEVKKYDDDPLCGFLFTLNGYRALLTLMRDAYSKSGWNVDAPALPVLFLSGADDPCLVDHAQFQRAAAHLRERGYENVTTKTYPGMRHEIMRERGSDQVIRDVLAFLDGHA